MTVFHPHKKIEEITQLEREQMISRARLNKAEIVFALITLGSFYFAFIYGLFSALV